MIMSEYMTSAAMSIRAGIPLLFRTPKPLGSRRNSDAEKKARELPKTHELALATKINTIKVSAARPHVLLGSKAATPLKPETFSPCCAPAKIAKAKTMEMTDTKAKLIQ